jgi:hypothetical protein
MIPPHTPFPRLAALPTLPLSLAQLPSQEYPWALALTITVVLALGMWDKLWRHWMGSKYGLSVIGPFAKLPLIPFFLRM